MVNETMVKAIFAFDINLTVRQFRLRLWVARKLIKFAAWILGCHIDFNRKQFQLEPMNSDTILPA